MKVLFVYNRYSVKVDYSDFMEFIRVETAKSLKVIGTTENVKMFLTLSCDVSYSTREAAKEGQAKDKLKDNFNVHHSHLRTRIVPLGGHRVHFKFDNRDASGLDAFPLSTKDFKSKDWANLQSAILLKCVVLCQRYISEETAVANGGGAAMPSRAGALTKKIHFPLVLK